jgi:hypothetical protein
VTTRGRPRNPTLPMRICIGCGDDYQPRRKAQKYCKDTCGLAVGRKRYAEKQKTYTRKQNYQGYWEIKLEDGTWVPEARHLYEQYHNVKLPSNIYVGFRDGDKNNLGEPNLFLKNPVLEEAVRATGKLPKLVNGKPPKIKRNRPPRPRASRRSKSTEQ